MRLIFPSLFFTGCNALDMAQTWQLDRIRILGAQAEPAEPRPGDQVSFTSLVFTPANQSLESVIWFACLPEGATSFGCSLDEDLLDSFDNQPATQEEQLELFQSLQEAGFAGIEPDLPLGWTVPTTALDSLSEEEKIEGLSAFVNITAIPEDSVDDEDVEVAYRRLPISENPQPNQNPDIIDVQIDGVSYTADDVLIAQAGQTYEINPIFSEDSIEQYPYVTPAGEIETREEAPYCTWYLEGGSFDQYFTLYPTASVGWTAPTEAHEGKIVMVVRDRRGGMDWAYLNVKVEQ